MSKTIHRDNYKIVNRTHQITDDDWDLAFRRDKKNVEKNRYKRSNKHEK